jgi:uncharacterized protein YcbX
MSFVERFRSNILLGGDRLTEGEAYVEEGWRELRVNRAKFLVRKKAPRCGMINIDPATGKKNEYHEPYRTLDGYKREDEGRATFGIYIFPTSEVEGRIARGDSVTIV